MLSGYPRTLGLTLSFLIAPLFAVSAAPVERGEPTTSPLTGTETKDSKTIALLADAIQKSMEVAADAIALAHESDRRSESLLRDLRDARAELEKLKARSGETVADGEMTGRSPPTVLGNLTQQERGIGAAGGADLAGAAPNGSVTAEAEPAASTEAALVPNPTALPVPPRRPAGIGRPGPSVRRPAALHRSERAERSAGIWAVPIAN